MISRVGCVYSGCCFRNLESACTFTDGYLGNLIILSESLLSYESRRLGGERFESVLSLLYSALFHETNSVRCEELVGKHLISKFTQSTSIPTPSSDIPIRVFNSFFAFKNYPLMEDNAAEMWR